MSPNLKVNSAILHSGRSYSSTDRVLGAANHPFGSGLPGTQLIQSGCMDVGDALHVVPISIGSNEFERAKPTTGHRETVWTTEKEHRGRSHLPRDLSFATVPGNAH